MGILRYVSCCVEIVWGDINDLFLEMFGERLGILNEWSDVINRMRK